MTATKKKFPAAAIEMAGVYYMRNPKGNLVALDNIGPIDLLMDEMVCKLGAYAEDLSAEMARFQSHSYADIADFDALLDQEFNAPRAEGRKGNRTFTSYDGSLKVKVCIADRLSFGPELQQAKQHLDAMIQERATGADPFLVTLVNQAFKVDKEGQVDASSIFALRRLQVDDPRWPDVCRAIDAARRPQGSKSYLRFYKRVGVDGRDQMIPLDLAAVEPTPEAFARPSLRRQVEELTAQISSDASVKALADLGEKLKALKKAFGAPGDYGYNTPEGAALYALYRSPGWAAAIKASAELPASAQDEVAA